MALNRQSTTDLKSTHPVSRSMLPPLSRGDLDQKPMISVLEYLLGGVDGERRTFFQTLLNHEPGREASERTTDLLLSKDGFSAFHALPGLLLCQQK